MKVLFLDIDGVLNSEKAFRAGTCDAWQKFCPDTVRNLNTVLTTVPDLKIVISSTWRIICTRGVLKTIFIQNDVEVGDRGQRIIDCTPRLPSAHRGTEISRWLIDNPVRTFAIVDDDRDMEPLMSRLVLVSSRVGFTSEDAQRTIGLLTQENTIEESS